MPGNSGASAVVLPVWVQSRLEEGDEEVWKGTKMEQTQMKDVIGDFLLESEA